jgi:hypothetical protein
MKGNNVLTEHQDTLKLAAWMAALVAIPRESSVHVRCCQTDQLPSAVLDQFSEWYSRMGECFPDDQANHDTIDEQIWYAWCAYLLGLNPSLTGGK